MLLGIVFALFLTLLCRDIFEAHGFFRGLLITGPAILFSFVAGIAIWIAGKRIHPNKGGKKGCLKA